MPSSSTSNVSLPVLKDKRYSRRRWTVLILVQVILLVHIGLWLIAREYGWFGGKTLTPIEPSEGMEFVKNGVINAGAIFFAVTLLATLIFGRWFCGWGCHIVLLQDACYWTMRKLHIRPKPFRSRMLMWFPFFLAVYMYIWPLFYRIVLAPTIQPDLRWPSVTTQLVTTEYWDSFAPPLVAVPFLLICGFATVYLLGAKGFCTYGCPYGGFFKPLGSLSPMRVRVNENCQQCGRCTAACTSNVRVHEEVYLHKMVIDSGCMKTMDCIDACPNDALHIGFGTNTIGQKYQRRSYDLSLIEEVWVFALFLGGFFAFRGLYGVVPMLMAVGMSLVTTWIIWKATTIIRRANASFHRTRLKYHGKLRMSGAVFLVIAVSVFLFTLHSGTVTTFHTLGDTALSNEHYDRAMYFYRLSGPNESGGIGFASNPKVDMTMATMLEQKGEFEEAEQLMRRVITRVGSNEGAMMRLGQIMQQYQPYQRVETFYHNTLHDHPTWALIWEDEVAWLKRSGMIEDAIDQSEISVELIPTSTRLRMQLALLEMEFRDPEVATALLRTLSIEEPNNPRVWMLFARALDQTGHFEESLQAISKAASLQGERIPPRSDE